MVTAAFAGEWTGTAYSIPHGTRPVIVLLWIFDEGCREPPAGTPRPAAR
jgi:hypothetical protein